MNISEIPTTGLSASEQSDQPAIGVEGSVAIPRRARVSAVAAQKPRADRKRRSYSWASRQR